MIAAAFAVLASMADFSNADVGPGGIFAESNSANVNSGTSTQFSMKIRVDHDPGITEYFWAQEFWLDTTVDHGGYFGIQANGISLGQWIGKSFIFSVWNATSAEADPGATAQTFGGEGVGYTIHRPFPWREGVGYRFQLTKEQTNWWGVSVLADSGEIIGLGRISIAEDTEIRSGFGNFTEYYGTWLPSCAQLPYAKATFYDYSFNGATFQVTAPTPYGLCGSLGSGTINGPDSTTHIVNPDSGGHVNLDQRGLTGAWADPSTSGQGLVMEVDPDFYGAGTGLLFGGWYTYDVTAVGGQRWYTIQGQVGATSASSMMAIYLTQGGSFASSLATTTTPVGQATLQFSDCMHGMLVYSFSDGSGRNGTVALNRLLANVTCGQTGDNGNGASDYLLAGAWADPTNSGQGLVFDINPIQNVLFAGWYTFAGNAGQGSGPAGQNWYTLQAVPIPGSSTVNNIGIYATAGGVFNSGIPTTTVPVGTANLVFNNCSSATLTYTFTAGTNNGRSGTMNLLRLGPVPAGCRL